MKFVIHKLYIWFGEAYEPRVLTFEENKVNVITGSSSTGKSNILAIIDFCLLSTKSNIVKPIVNEFSDWYGLEFTLGEQFFAVARPAPSIDVPTPHAIINKEPFAGYPDATKLMPVNDARNILNLAFGYRKKDNDGDEFRYRSNFIFNYLTENMINSPYDYLNYKYFTGKVAEKDYRETLLDESLTRNLKDVDKIKSEIDGLESKQSKYEEAVNKEDKARGKLEDVEGRLIGNGIMPPVNPDMSLSERFQRVKAIVDNLNNISSSDKETEAELQQLKDEYFRNVVQLNNMLRAKEEFEKYHAHLETVEDSLSPIAFVKSKLPELGSNMWTNHIIGALDTALQDIKKANENAKDVSLVDDARIKQLKDKLQELNTKIKDITQIKSSVENHFAAFITIGKVERELRTIENAIKAIPTEDVQMLSDEENQKLLLLRHQVEEMENYDKWGLLDESFQAIYDQFEYMEYFSGYKTKYDSNLEQLVLNDGKSVINVETLGSQSNYMFMHVCFFLGLHRYYADYDTSKIAQFLFIDQPSIPYYVGAGEIKTTDKEKLSDAFKAINQFEAYVVEEKKRDFQIILIEHAPTSYWTGDNQLDYFHTVIEFVNGEALIPSEIIKAKQQ